MIKTHGNKVDLNEDVNCILPHTLGFCVIYKLLKNCNINDNIKKEINHEKLPLSLNILSFTRKKRIIKQIYV
jgi:hypothetical protein